MYTVNMWSSMEQQLYYIPRDTFELMYFSKID